VPSVNQHQNPLNVAKVQKSDYVQYDEPSKALTGVEIMRVPMREALHLRVLLQSMEIKALFVTHCRSCAVKLLGHLVEASTGRVGVMWPVATAL
jgi:ABC-type sulfate/molybdate transport systems ATPase subunit